MSRPHFSAEQLARIDALCAGALERPAAERQDFVQARCGDEPEVCREVLSIVHYADETAAFLDEPAAVPPAEMPQRIGRYRVLERLGAGGMGVVYLAEQDDPQRTVALKVIRAAGLSEDLKRRFRHEAQVLGHLKHPGIAEIYEASTAADAEGGQLYFAMEYIEGRALDRYATEQRLNPRERMELLARVCDAVHHAHQKGVIHRDLKPGNILVISDAALTGTGTDVTARVGQPKVLDFGIARATDADVHTVQTHTGQIIGTIPYMSPEQVSGEAERLDIRSDVYALGVILYELLVGELPYPVARRSLVEAIRVIREQEPQRIGARDPLLRGDVEAIVAKALEKDPGRRYDSAAELAADVRRHLHDEPVQARPLTTFYQLRKFAARNRRMVGATVALFVVLLAGVVSSTVFALRESEQRQRAEARFGDVRGFAKAVIVDYQKRLDNEGATRARAFLVTTARDYLDGLARDRDALDTATLRDLAGAYSAIGDTLGQPNAGNLGDIQGALDNYELAASMYENLLPQRPDDVDLKMLLAVAYERIGNIHVVEDRLNEALQIYEQALAIKERIADVADDGQLALSYSYNKLADVYVRSDRLDDAVAMYQRSLDIRKALAEDPQAGGQAARGYSVGLNRIADVLMKMERFDEALDYYTQSQQRRQSRLQGAPDSAQAQFDVIVGHSKRAEALVALERQEEAIDEFGEGRKRLIAIAQRDPQNVTARFGVFELDTRIGQALGSVGRHEQALELLGDTEKQFRAAVGDQPIDSNARRLLTLIYDTRITALDQLGRADEAEAARLLRAKLQPAADGSE